MNRILILTLCVFNAACGAAQSDVNTQTPEASPPAHRSRPFWQMDPDIQRLFGNASPFHALPQKTSWSPDSSAVAYLRTATVTKEAPGTELWLYDIERGVEFPMLSGDEVHVSEYCWIDENRIAAISNGDIWLLSAHKKKQRLTRTRTAEKSVKAAPDGTKIAYIRNHNIILLDLISMIERPLTKAGEDRLTFGETTWLYEEELGTEAGFGWSPKSDRIWFYETDLTKVTFRGIDLSSGDIKVMPYPHPGEPNPVLKVGVLDTADPTKPPKYLLDGHDKDIYVPRVIWHPDGERLLITELDRLQTTLTLKLCSVAEARCTTVISDTDPRYVDLLDGPIFIKDGKEMVRLTEANGFAHIERVRMDTFARTPLTKGKFEVFALNHIDQESGTIIFTANPEDTGERKLYSIPLSGGEVMTIPQENGNHSVTYAPNGQFFVDAHSALDRPPRIDIKNNKGERTYSLAKTMLPESLIKEITNETFPIDAKDGTPIMAHLTRPTHLDPDTKYPALVIVYGGPHCQLTKNAFHTTYQPWRNLLAKRGILVFTVDGRGSCGRGHDFEAAVRLNLGRIELDDQLTGVAHLQSLPFVDPNRIGIFGWSYGGYMVLNAVLRTKKIFKIGVAVAPVTDWRYYDSTYTERYMQRPKDNPAGYSDASVLPLASKLEIPLLLVHGIADDNVHLIHSQKLLSAFTSAERFVEHIFYPGKDHKIGGANTRVHLFTRITRFIEDNL